MLASIATVKFNYAPTAETGRLVVISERLSSGASIGGLTSPNCICPRFNVGVQRF